MSFIKYKNMVVTREQLNKAKDLQKKADENYKQKKKDLWASTNHAGWSDLNRAKMIREELKSHEPKTMRQYLKEVM